MSTFETAHCTVPIGFITVSASMLAVKEAHESYEDLGPTMHTDIVKS